MDRAGAGRGLTAFGSSLRKLFRIHFLSPLSPRHCWPLIILSFSPAPPGLFFMAARLFYLNVLISFLENAASFSSTVVGRVLLW